MRREVALLLAALPLSAGCKDIQRFSTGAGESYCGRIVAAPFVREGFGDSVCMRMTFDSDHLHDTPGTLWTDDQLLTAAPMRPFPKLFHDPLLTFTFGEGRDKNFLFAVDPTGASGGPTTMVVLSLMHSGDAEVRLIRGARADGSTTSSDPGGSMPLFGVFSPLTHEPGTCAAVKGCAWKTE